ncbi:hypothetical protein [Tsukamurella paurometabola]
MTLIRLIAGRLRPYAPWLWTVAAFQLVSVIANLALPSINAKIVDLGVTPGDTGYIWRMGAIMLAVTLLQVVAAPAPPTSVPAPRWPSVVTPAALCSTPSAASPAARWRNSVRPH